MARCTLVVVPDVNLLAPLQVLKQLYDTDILTEDALLAWADEKADAAAEDRRFLTLVRTLEWPLDTQTPEAPDAHFIFVVQHSRAWCSTPKASAVRPLPAVEPHCLALTWLQAAPLIDWLRTADESEEESDEEE